MKEMFNTGFGAGMFFLLYVIYMLFIWGLRHTYEIPLFFEGVALLLLVQFFPFIFLYLFTVRWVVVKNIRLRIVIWFSTYLLFFLLAWYATGFYYLNKV